MLDWNDLKLILELSRAGSMSGAARVLGVNHATLSRQLTRLETRSERRFFDRLPNGLVPTTLGKTAIARAEAMEREVLALDLDLTAQESSGGKLRVTIPPLMADPAFGEDIAIWRSKNPNCEFELLGGNRIVNLHRREADIAIRVQHDPRESLWGRKIVNQNAGLYATSEYLDRYRDALDGQGALPFISFSVWDRPIPKSIQQAFPNTEMAVLCDDMIAAISLVKAGVGFTRMPHFIAASDPAFIQLPDTVLTPYMPIWALTHPDLRHNSQVSGFIRFIAARFTARREIFEGPAT